MIQATRAAGMSQNHTQQTKRKGDKMEDIANRLFNLLDFYEARDTDTTPETVLQDITNNPIDVINYLITELEELTA